MVIAQGSVALAIGEGQWMTDFHRCHLLFGGQQATRHCPATSRAMPQLAHMHMHTRVHTHVYTRTRTNTCTNPVLCKPPSFAHGNSQTHTQCAHVSCMHPAGSCAHGGVHTSYIPRACCWCTQTHTCVHIPCSGGIWHQDAPRCSYTPCTHTNIHIPGDTCLHAQPEAHKHTHTVLPHPSPPSGTHLWAGSAWTPLQGSQGTSTSQTTHMGTPACPCRAWLCSHHSKTYLRRMRVL